MHINLNKIYAMILAGGFIDDRRKLSKVATEF